MKNYHSLKRCQLKAFWLKKPRPQRRVMKKMLWGHLIPCLPWKKKYSKQFVISLGHEKRFLKPKPCNTTGCSLPGCKPDPVPRVPFPRSWSHFQQQLPVPLLIPHIPPALPPPSPCNHFCFYLTQIPLMPGKSISKWEPRASKGRIPTRAVSGVTQSTAHHQQLSFWPWKNQQKNETEPSGGCGTEPAWQRGSH